MFPAGATAVKVASVSNNLDMLKLLRRYGSEPIPMPEQEVTAKNSTEVFYTMKVCYQIKYSSPKFSFLFLQSSFITTTCMLKGFDSPTMLTNLYQHSIITARDSVNFNLINFLEKELM